MELSKKEKDHIIAEELARLEARHQFMKDSHCAPKKAGFWTGLLVGVLLYAVAGFVCRHACGGYRMGCSTAPSCYGEGSGSNAGDNTEK